MKKLLLIALAIILIISLIACTTTSTILTTNDPNINIPSTTSKQPNTLPPDCDVCCEDDNGHGGDYSDFFTYTRFLPVFYQGLNDTMYSFPGCLINYVCDKYCVYECRGGASCAWVNWREETAEYVSLLHFIRYFNISRETFIELTFNEYHLPLDEYFDPSFMYSSAFISLLFADCHIPLYEAFVNPNALLVDGEIFSLGWFMEASFDDITAQNFDDDVLFDYFGRLESRVADGTLTASVLDNATALYEVAQEIARRR